MKAPSQRKPFESHAQKAGSRSESDRPGTETKPAMDSDEAIDEAIAGVQQVKKAA